MDETIINNNNHYHKQYSYLTNCELSYVLSQLFDIIFNYSITELNNRNNSIDQNKTVSFFEIIPNNLSTLYSEIDINNLSNTSQLNNIFINLMKSNIIILNSLNKSSFILPENWFGINDIFLNIQLLRKLQNQSNNIPVSWIATNIFDTILQTTNDCK